MLNGMSPRWSQVSSGGRAVGRLTEYPMKAVSMEAYSNSTEVNPNFYGGKIASMNVDESFHEISSRRFPCNQYFSFMKVTFTSMEVHK